MSPLHRRTLLQIGLAAGAACFLPAARACEFWSSNLRVFHPWTRATAQEAGSAIVCMKFDEVAADDRLVAVETPVAEGAELAGDGVGPELDFAIPAGRETLLGETGTTLRLVRLLQPLEVARTYPLRLVFARGGAVNANLTVEYTRFK